MNKVDLVIFKNLIFLDRPFTYLSKEKIENGSFVLVDFNGQLEIGLVINSNTLEDEDEDKDDYKEVIKLVKEVAPLPDLYIKLGLWMKNFYVTTYAKAFSTISDLTRIDKLRYEFVSLTDDEDIEDFVQVINNRIHTKDKKRISELLQRQQIKQEPTYRLISPKKEVYYKFNMDIGQGLKTIRSNATRQLGLILEIYDIFDKKDFFSHEELSKLDNYDKQVFDQLLERGIFDQLSNHEISYNTKKNDLTVKQEKIYQAIKSLDKNKFLIHGVTGSGKTEIYFKLIEDTVGQDKTCLFLVPEIGLTPQMEGRIKTRFGNKVAIIHSKLTKSQRLGELDKLRQGEAKILLGTRSAVFVPMENLGLIIIDEEHDKSYQLDENNKYDAREVSRFLVESTKGAKLILGSATPSVDTYYKAQHGVYDLLELDTRAKDTPMPKVTIADMREELKQGNTSPFSMDLMAAIKSSLNRGRQVVLFLNRRGYAPFVSCRDCGETIRCDRCDISMVYHKSRNSLECHYCGMTKALPSRCPACSSPKIRQFGLGTEKLAQLTSDLYPDHNVLRIDSDTTSNMAEYEENIRLIESRQVDIIIGTQMISKGLDFSAIDTVGVVAADLSLNIPDFRSAEETFQILTQVAGRAGRDLDQGNVVIQSYNPDHFSIQASKDHDYKEFYKREIQLRKAFNYPPFSRLYTLEVRSNTYEESTKVAEKIYQGLGEILKNYNLLRPVSIISQIDRLMTLKINNRFRTDIVFSSSIRDEKKVKKGIYKLVFENIYKIDLKNTHVDLIYS